MSELITQPPQAIVITEYEAIDLELKIIEQDAATVSFDYTDKKGNKDARSYRASVRKVATRLEAVRVGAKRFYLDSGKAIDAEAKKIVARIDAITNPHTIELKKLDDEEKERVSNHKAVVTWINETTDSALANGSPESLQSALDELDIIVTDGAEEFKDETDKALLRSIAKLKEGLEHAIKVQEQFIEIKRLQDEAAERKRLDDIAAAAKQAEELERAKSAAMIAKAEFMAKESQQRAAELEQREKDRIAADKQKAESDMLAKLNADADREAAIAETYEAMVKIVRDDSTNALLDAIIDGKVPHLTWSNQ